MSKFIQKTTFLLIQIALLIALSKTIKLTNLIQNKTISFFIFLGILALYILAIWLSKKISTDVLKVNLQFSRINADELWLIVKTYLIQITATILINLLAIHFIGHVKQVNQDNINHFLSQLSPANLLLAVMYAAVVGPILEEFVFRGYLMNAFFKPNQQLYKILLSAFLFAIPHMHSIFLTPATIPTFLSYLVLGLSFGYVYSRSNKITVSMGLHILNNTISLIPVFLFMN
ncbi:CPBP family intramembrane glutamic endopeptidase [Convivina intestini]|uniref:CAAX prenyl protease-like protein n=1 Tax=Convivina intestini TaxID=1505726 RepID=A0A2U1D589_9LACO|nr:type II CAAX endopeptidase family protein [Convivina intestini]PVY82854.1 CAAX prenyl protease-like protein [Convivina intestini]CAH1856918.1 hypothetical protein R077811_01370 [Convivina intestini]SDC11590.1 CAAX protease self-immunity [Leuconostocaceae bacterium R-53105]